ncbi:insulin receptor substrate 1-like [Lucilia sericata]|uniref:insulin receptor substrate 1-like n=1 Tax=Lucilia sericata TaxID=13632 RepID=UPI0018A83879|nr:insulin receptor substrate 1-like [Lucilia sericata]
MNVHTTNTSPVTYSASEESVSVEESEESMGMPYLLSSRSPEGVIPEEYIDDAVHSEKRIENNDMNSVAALSLGPGCKVNMNLIKQNCSAKVTDINKIICGNIDDQLLSSFRANSYGTKYGNDLSKDAIVNRVRAFSVGSKIKSTRICSKTSPKLFNSDNIKHDFGESSTRKSISVPVLINRNLQAVDQMGDLMEIDFSKSTAKTVKQNLQQNKFECQNASNMLPRNFNISNSTEYIYRSLKNVDNGYLEMKPITLTSNNNQLNNACINTLNQDNIKQKDSTETIIDMMDASIKKVTNYQNLDDKSDGKSSILINDSTLSLMCSKLCPDKNFEDIKLHHADAPCTKQDLYYASLDLPKCGNEVNTRYGFKESLSDSHIGEIKNEYAKINFDKPETSCNIKEENK